MGAFFLMCFDGGDIAFLHTKLQKMPEDID